MKEIPRLTKKQEERLTYYVEKGDKAGFEKILQGFGFATIPKWEKEYNSASGYSIDHRGVHVCCRNKNADMLRFLFDKGATISKRDARDTSLYSFFGELIGNAKQEDIPKVREILQILVDAGYKIPSHMEPLVYRELCALVRDDIELYKEFDRNGLRYDSANAANGLHNLLSTHSFNALAYFESKGCFEKTDHTKELRIWEWWDTDILEYCLNKGWKPVCVNGDCEKGLLLAALRNGIELWHGDVESICSSLDAEIIEACLKAGVHKVYPESAKKAGREDLLALYSKYGFDALDETHNIIKGVIQGTLPLASLPEMIAAGTHVDWKEVTAAVATCRYACRPYPGILLGGSWYGVSTMNPASYFSESVDWIPLFQALLESFEGNLEAYIRIPTESSDLKSFDGSHVSSHYWADTDVEVYRMLVDRGAQLVCGTREAVIVHCAPDVVDFLFELNGWDWKNLRFTDFAVNECLRHGGNANAFRWIYKNRRKAVDIERFKLPKYFASGMYDMFLAVLETKDNGSLKTPKAIEYLVSFCEQNNVQGVKLLIQKLALSPATIQKALYAIAAAKAENDATQAADEGLRAHPKAPRSLREGNYAPVETELEKDPVAAEQPIDENAAKRADALARCGSIYVHVSGQQSYGIWCQQVGIAYTDIPFEDAKGLVKLNSMMQGEYDYLGEYFEGGYAGLSMLANDIERYGTMLQKDIEENGAPESYGKEFEEALGREASASDFGRYLVFMASREPDLYAKYLAYLPEHHTDEGRPSIDEVGDKYVDTLFLHHRPIFKEHFSWCNNFDGEGTCGPNEAERITDAEWEDRFYDGFNHATDAGELFDPAKFSLECHNVGTIETDEGDSIVFGSDEFVGLVMSHEGF